MPDNERGKVGALGGNFCSELVLPNVTPCLGLLEPIRKNPIVIDPGSNSSSLTKTPRNSEKGGEKELYPQVNVEQHRGKCLNRVSKELESPGNTGGSRVGQ